MFLLYEALLYLAAILLMPWFAIAGLARGKYLGSVRERLGRYPSGAAAHDLWIHAVSVGEVGAAKTVLERVREMRPNLSVVVSTTTATGQATARGIFADTTVTYFPFDFSFSVRRFLNHYRPRVFASVETEIWPNTLRLASGRGIRSVLLNARLSDQSYPRYRWLRLFWKPLLGRYASILARDDEDRRRFIAIGAPAPIVEVCGNVKFDFRADSTPLALEAPVRRWIAARKLFIAGSTMEGEDEMLLPHLPQLIDAGCVIAIAPRKPERFAAVASLLERSRLRFARRSEIKSEVGSADVLLLDTIGELARMYRLATVAFIGGSLVPRGGHNPIEAAAVGTPVAFGPHMTNFRDVVATFLAAGVARQVRNVDELIRFVLEVISNEEKRGELSRGALAVIERNRGAALRNAQRIVELLA